MLKVSFHTLGCRLNQSETSLLEGLFLDKGFSIVSTKSSADIFVLNSCTVTQASDSDARQAINRAVRLNDKVKVAIIGCQAQVQKEALFDLPNVIWVVGTQKKMDLPEIMISDLQANNRRLIISPIKRVPFELPLTTRKGRRTRANLKIQDGCDNFCAYCEVPFARGRSRSRVFKNVLDEAKALVLAGHKEIVLTGINIGLYDNQGQTLVDVIRGMELIQGLERIRISSIEGAKIPLDLIECMASSKKLCPFFHLPLQSGSDYILKKMGRRYTVEDFKITVLSIAKNVPGVMLGTDVIVGFPGETDEDFDQTYQLLKNLPVHYFHVFVYSDRNRARSRLFKGQVAAEVSVRRSKMLRDLSVQKKKDFFRNLLGSIQVVLIEQKKNNYWIGHSANYVKIKTYSDKDLKNMLVDVKIDEVSAEGAVGSII